MREKASVDAHIAAVIRVAEELQAFVSMLENFNVDDGTKLVSKLREIANLFDTLPLLANDLVTLKRRLRGMMTIDPDETPRPVSLKELKAVSIPPERRRGDAVDQEYRTRTQPGIGITTKPPLPKRTPT